MKGFILIGALLELEKVGLLAHVDQFVGVSIGAVLSTLLALDYSVTEIEDLFVKTKLDDVYYRSTWQLFSTYGFDSGQRARAWLQKTFRAKGYDSDLTFAQLFSHTGKQLFIGVTCLNTSSFELFSPHHESSCKIIEAVCMSISVPFLFSPVTYQNKIYMDGAMTCILPLHHFPEDDNESLAIYMSTTQACALELTGMTGFLSAVVDVLLYQLTQSHWVKTVLADRADVAILNIEEDSPILVNLDESQRRGLVDKGVQRMREWLQEKYPYQHNR